MTYCLLPVNIEISERILGGYFDCPCSQSTARGSDLAASIIHAHCSAALSYESAISLHYAINSLFISGAVNGVFDLTAHEYCSLQQEEGKGKKKVKLEFAGRTR